MYKFLKTYWFVVGLCLAIVLRFVYLDKIPAGITLSESKVGFSVLNGNIFDSFLSVLVYISNLFIENNLLAVRFPFALISVGGIFGFYFLNKIYFSTEYARVVTLVFAFTPWLIMASRTVDYWFFYFNLCLLMLALIWRNKNNEIKKWKIGITLLFVVIYVWFAFRQIAKQSLFGNIGVMNSINEMRGQGTLFKPTAFWSKLFFNKSYFLIKMLRNAFDLLKPQTYFAQLRLSHEFINTETGLFLSVFIIPFLIGGVSIVKKIKKRQALEISLMISFFSLPLVLSRYLVLDLLFPFVVLVSSLVALGFLSMKKHKLALISLLLIAMYNFVFVTYQYVFKYPKAQEEERCIYYKQIATEVKNGLDKYDNIFVVNNLCSNLTEIINFELLQFDPNIDLQKVKTMDLDNWVIDLNANYLFLVDPKQKVNFLKKYHVPTGLNVEVSKSQSKEPCFKKKGEIKNSLNEIIVLIYETNNHFCLMR